MMGDTSRRFPWIQRPGWQCLRKMLYRPAGDLLGGISADFRLKRSPTSIYKVLLKVSSSGHISAAVHAPVSNPQTYDSIVAYVRLETFASDSSHKIHDSAVVTSIIILRYRTTQNLQSKRLSIRYNIGG